MLGWEYPPHVVGGLGVHCAEVTKELVKRGVEVDFYKPKIDGSPSDTHLKIHEVFLESSVTKDTYELKSFYEAVSEYNQKLTREFDPKEVSLIHCHDWIAAEAAIQLSRKYSVPLISTMHSTEFDRSAFFNPQQWIMAIEERLVTNSNRVIAVSNLTKSLIADYYGRKHGVDVVYNGFNPINALKPDYSPKGRVIFLGRITTQKGPLFLVRAAKIFCQTTDAEIIFSGTGSSDSEVLREADKLGLSDRVKLLGHVSSEEVSYWLTHSDAYVLPAVSEPFGMTVLEAMSTGLPTIISKSTGVGESLNNVLKFDYWDTEELADLVSSTLSSTGLRSTMGPLGREETKSFSWARCGEQTYEVYRRVLAHG
jgi:glycogen(starch) synthase